MDMKFKRLDLKQGTRVGLNNSWSSNPFRSTLYSYDFKLSLKNNLSRDSSVGTETGYGLEGRFRFPVGARDFSLLHCIQTGSWAHLASYSMGTRGAFNGGKAAGA
jgi:hypothetical protein